MILIVICVLVLDFNFFNGATLPRPAKTGQLAPRLVNISSKKTDRDAGKFLPI